MFLALTEDTQFWPTEGAVIGLGRWCAIDGAGRARINSILPYHWDSREALFKDWEVLRDFYEQVLSALANSLNAQHGTDYSLKYWRAILGTFVSRFVEVIFDRYRSLLCAHKDGSVSELTIRPSGNLGLHSANEFIELSESSAGNFAIYSDIISELGLFAEAKKNVLPVTHLSFSIPCATKLNLRSIVRRLAAGGNLLGGRGRVVFADAHFPRWAQGLLELSLWQTPGFSLPNPRPPPAAQLDMMVRVAVASRIQASGEFAELFRALLPRYLPTVYLENFWKFRATVLGKLPRKPAAIVAGSAHEASEAFRFWLAEHREQGVPVALVQHGGVYGMGRFSSVEYDERKLGDVYYSWGWREERDVSVRSLPASKLIGTQPRVKKIAGNILWSWNGVPTYAYRLYSVPIAGQIEYFYQFQKEFIGAVIPEIKERMVLRLYPKDRGWRERTRWPDNFEGVSVYQGKESFERQLQQASLFICAYHGTTFLQSLAANIPTLIVWDERFWELRPEAVEAFKKLQEVGIFLPVASQGAKQLNLIGAAPWDWWQSEQVQQVRQKFIKQYALMDQQWLPRWKNAIQTLRDSNKLLGKR